MNHEGTSVKICAPFRFGLQTAICTGVFSAVKAGPTLGSLSDLNLFLLENLISRSPLGSQATHKYNH